VRSQLELANDLAAALAGNHDAMLRALEQRLGVRVFLRGNLLTLDGDAAAVESGARVVDELATLAAGGHPLDESALHSVIGLLDGDSAPTQVLDDVIWRHRATRVVPRTLGQKRYVDSIRSNTITFGIGPAGTGKTFLAVALAAAALSRREVNRIILTRPAVEAGA
jgi:phosphate starvation-inducible PhoH-like protein